MGFHNPYNFVRTPDRDNILEKPFAGDYDPSQHDRQENHSRYWEERYTGVIPVRLRTRTPLFITDPETKREDPTYRGQNENDKHYIYDCMKEIPATAIKGMLSSAYEIITNSRYRVFLEKQHNKYLGYRNPPTTTPTARVKLTPAKIVVQGGKFFAELYTDAAWLPAYDCPAIGGFHNGQYCNKVTIEEYHYCRVLNPDAEPQYQRKLEFDFWSVKDINGTVFSKITDHIDPVTPKGTRVVSGYVVKSGKIFNKKHDERFFFDPNGVFPISDEVRKRYERLIEDYQDKHKIVGGKRINPPIAAGTIHGLHITDTSRLKMTNGLFVYVLKSGNGIKAVYPVQISRDLSDATPWNCLDEYLHPATKLDELSPADRLFGWVPQKGKGAWRGKVRVVCDPYDEEMNGGQKAVETFEPFPLSILGAPKPEQARFYCGDNEGKPQNNGITKQNATYKPNKRLRGRKVYLHHSLSHLTEEERQGYWDVAGGVTTNQEYSRFPDTMIEKRSNQNRSISSWIPPERTFTFKLYVENLTKEELGALLTILRLKQDPRREGESPDPCYFRLGLGKPLGFGSVELSLIWNKGIPVMKGSALGKRYKTLDDVSTSMLTDEDVQKSIQAYQVAMARAYNETQNNVDFSIWEDHEFVGLLKNEELEEFRETWKEALYAGQTEVPVSNLKEKTKKTVETALEIYPDLKEELQRRYDQNLREMRNVLRNLARRWNNIPFINDFKTSMSNHDDPILYPQRDFDNRREGFKWFVENERCVNDNPVNGYSLPEMGQTLDYLAD